MMSPLVPVIETGGHAWPRPGWTAWTGLDRLDWPGPPGLADRLDRLGSPALGVDENRYI